jgi:hypothetical protein
MRGSTQSARRALWWALLVLIARGGGARARAGEARDELVWTKANWREYKLDFPFAFFAEREPELARVLGPGGPAAGLAASTLGGPYADLPARAAADAERQASPLRAATFEMSPLDSASDAAAAAGVVGCHACGALAAALWGVLGPHADAHRAAPPPAQLAALAEELCDVEVPVQVLSEHVLLRAKVTPPGAAPAGVPADGGAGAGLPGPGALGGPGVREFYMLIPRQRQHATEAELGAVRDACRALLAEAAPPLVRPEDAVAAPAAAAAEAARAAAARARAGGAAPPAAPPETPDAARAPAPSPFLAEVAVQVAEYLAALDAAVGPAAGRPARGAPPAPAPQRACADRHPQCGYWAGLGECEANPGYMVGYSREREGVCRAACEACAPPPPPRPRGWSDAGAAAASAAAAAALERFLTRGCEEAAACRWAADGASRKLALLGGAGAGGAAAAARAALDSRAAVVSGPVGGGAAAAAAAPSLGLADADTASRLAASVAAVRPHSAALVAASRGGPAPAGAAAAAAPAPAARALAAALGGRCLYVGGGANFWTYELCYGGNATQARVEHGAAAAKGPVWEIALGGFERAEWAPRAARDADLYPAGAAAPFVAHRLSGGSLCNLTDAGAAAGAPPPTQVTRGARVRFFCSPDAALHMTVAEPRRCRYALDVYVPELCGIEGMAPRAGAGAAGAGAGGAAAAASGEEEDDDDDEYLDAGEGELPPRDEL